MLRDLCRDKHPEGFVFTNPRTGNIYSDTSLYRIWKKVRKASGINVTIYEATRHSLASIAVCNGASLKAIQDVLGHTDIRTTLKYSHSDLQSQKTVFKKQADIINIVPRLSPESKQG